MVKVRNYLSVLAFEKKIQYLAEKHSIQYNFYYRWQHSNGDQTPAVGKEMHSHNRRKKMKKKRKNDFTFWMNRKTGCWCARVMKKKKKILVYKRMEYDPNLYLRKSNVKTKWISKLDWTHLTKENWYSGSLKLPVRSAAKNVLGKEFKNTEWPVDGFTKRTVIRY